MHFAADAAEERQLRGRRDEILSEYCTPKKRAYLDGVYSYSRPAVYEQVVAENLLDVETVNRTKVHVDTKRLRGRAYRFVVAKKTDGWRIDGVKWRFSDDAEWEPALIGS